MIDNGKSMRTICEELSLKRSTITRWLSKEYEEDYQNAKQERAECLADKLMEEATVELKGDSSDNARVRAARLQVDTLKWITGKLYPAQYGERMQMTGNKSAPFVVEVINFADAKPSKRE